VYTVSLSGLFGKEGRCEGITPRVSVSKIVYNTV